MSGAREGGWLRGALARARLMLVFTPELCGERDPLEVLEAALPHVDLVQVRPKARATSGSREVACDPPCEARACHDWTRRVLELIGGGSEAPPVLVNDRVDVALALRDEGCAGVHVGQHDFPAGDARRLLGPELLIGLSTHDAGQVVRAGDQPVDYLGFGPAFPSATKGYAIGRGPEACWVADQGASRPLFPIGGITLEGACELASIGRAAVGGAILGAEDPGRAAREMQRLLAGEG